MKRFTFFAGACVLVSAGTALVVACTDPPAPKAGLPTSPAGDDDDTKKKKGTSSSGAGDDDAVTTNPEPAADPKGEGGLPPPGKVFGHTARSLYLFDPLVKTLKKIGDFTGLDDTNDTPDRVLDIALDHNSVMYGTSDKGFLKINTDTGAVTYKKQDPSINYPNALAFVPTGTVDPTQEALVGYQQQIGTQGATKYVRIDLASGAISAPLGDLNPPGAALQWRSSGDIIAFDRGSIHAYVTVKLYNPDGGVVAGDPGTDSLAEINPKTGQIINIIGDIGQPDFYGLGQWAGKAYGFNAGGNIVEINLTTGQGTTLLTLKEDGGTSQWFGAGVTTDAPSAPTK